MTTLDTARRTSTLALCLLALSLTACKDKNDTLPQASVTSTATGSVNPTNSPDSTQGVNTFEATITPKDGSGESFKVSTRPEDRDKFKVRVIGKQHFSIMLNNLWGEGTESAPIRQIVLSASVSHPGSYPMGEREGDKVTMQVVTLDQKRSKDGEVYDRAFKTNGPDSQGTMTIEAVDYDAKLLKGSFDSIVEQTDAAKGQPRMYRIEGSFFIDGE